MKNVMSQEVSHAILMILWWVGCDDWSHVDSLAQMRSMVYKAQATDG